MQTFMQIKIKMVRNSRNFQDFFPLFYFEITHSSPVTMQEQMQKKIIVNY